MGRTLKWYGEEVARTSKHPDRTQREHIANFALGVAGEAGEVCDLIKKEFHHDKPFNRDAFVKECGDLLWYLTALASQRGVTLEEIAGTNVAKLRLRFPLGFTTEAANARADEVDRITSRP